MSGGARLVALDFTGAAGLAAVPPQLACLTQLRQLTLSETNIAGGWECLPPQLEQLDLSQCDLEEVPAALTGLTRLRELALAENSIAGGWHRLPL